MANHIPKTEYSNTNSRATGRVKRYSNRIPKTYYNNRNARAYGMRGSNESQDSNGGAGASALFRIVGIMIIFAILVAFVSTVINGEPYQFDFESFVSLLENMPTLDISFLQDVNNLFPRITADWDVFNFLRDFLNGLTGVWNSVFSFLFLIGNGLVQLLSLVGYFFGWV